MKKKLFTIFSLLSCLVVTSCSGYGKPRSFEDINNSIINSITDNMMKTIVRIEIDCYDLNEEGDLVFTDTYTGSGVVVAYSSTAYLALTCDHVLNIDKNHSQIVFSAYDYLNNCYKIEDYIFTTNVGLGMFSFKAPETSPLKNVENIYTEKLEKEDWVFSASLPRTQASTVTMGQVLDFPKSSTIYKSQDFNIIAHNAKMPSASCGGPLFNEDLSLVGINYAVSEEDDYGFWNTVLAIPADIVFDFYTDFKYKLGF